MTRCDYHSNEKGKEQRCILEADSHTEHKLEPVEAAAPTAAAEQ